MRIVRAALSVVAVEAALALALLAVTPYLVGRIGASSYGILALVTVISSQLGLLQFGAGAAAARLLPEARARQGEAEVSALVSAVVFVSVIGALFSGAVLAVVLPALWGDGFHASAAVVQEGRRALPAAVAMVAVHGPLGNFQAVLLGHERFAELAYFRLSHGFLRLAAAVVAVAAGARVPGLILAQTSVDVVCVLVLLSMIWRGIPARGAGVVSSIRRLIVVGIPLAVSTTLAGLLVDAEKLALAAVRSIDELSYYTIPQNVAMRFAVAAAALATALVPRLSWMGAAGQEEEAGRLSARATRVSATLTAALFAVLIAIAPELLTAWLGAEFAANAVMPARIVMIGLVANVGAYAAAAVLRARARPVVVAAIYAAELPIYLVLAATLITWMGLVGAALAWSLRVIIDAVIQQWLAERSLGKGASGARSAWVAAAAVLIVALISVNAALVWRIAVGLVTAGLLLRHAMQAEDWSALLSAILGGRRISPT